MSHPLAQKGILSRIMEFSEVYNFLFGTTEGVLLLVGAALVISLLLAIIFEFKTRKQYKDRGFKNPEDDWNSPDYEG